MEWKVVGFPEIPMITENEISVLLQNQIGGLFFATVDNSPKILSEGIQNIGT